MAEYQLTRSPNFVRRPSENMLIPNDPVNADWIKYQAWLADGGVPDPVPPTIDPALDSVGTGTTVAEILGVT